jgi:hypothetical protein
VRRVFMMQVDRNTDAEKAISEAWYLPDSRAHGGLSRALPMQAHSPSNTSSLSAIARLHQCQRGAM